MREERGLVSAQPVGPYRHTLKFWKMEWDLLSNLSECHREVLYHVFFDVRRCEISKDMGFEPV